MGQIHGTADGTDVHGECTILEIDNLGGLCPILIGDGKDASFIIQLESHIAEIVADILCTTLCALEYQTAFGIGGPEHDAVGQQVEALLAAGVRVQQVVAEIQIQVAVLMDQVAVDDLIITVSTLNSGGIGFHKVVILTGFVDVLVRIGMILCYHLAGSLNLHIHIALLGRNLAQIEPGICDCIGCALGILGGHQHMLYPGPDIPCGRHGNVGIPLRLSKEAIIGIDLCQLGDIGGKAVGAAADGARTGDQELVGPNFRSGFGIQCAFVHGDGHDTLCHILICGNGFTAHHLSRCERNVALLISDDGKPGNLMIVNGG